jgi:hypothetical protein
VANEIQLNISMVVANGTFRDTFVPGPIAVTQSAIGRGGYVQSIGTSEEVIDFGDVVTNGYAILRNLDTTNYVDYGPESSGALVLMGRLKAGEVAILRVSPGVVMRAIAHTAAVKLDVRLYED